MRRLLLFFVLLFVYPVKAQVYPAPPGTGTAANLPHTCRQPQSYFATDTSTLYICISNTAAYPSNWGTAGGGAITPGAIPGTAGVNAVPVQSGLMAEYRMLPTETVAALVDYSGNSNNATGTTGTAPTIIATTGGVSCGGAGGILLPAGVNTALTIQVFASIQLSQNISGLESVVLGTGSAYAGLGVFNSSSNPLYQNVIVSTNTAGLAASSSSYVAGTFSMAETMGTTDNLYINGFPVLDAYSSSSPSAGLNNGPYEICGRNGGQGGFWPGNIYYAVFYNRVLTSSEIAQNAQWMQSTMSARSLSPIVLQANDTSDTLVSSGESIVNCAGAPNQCWSSFLLGLNGAAWTIKNVAQTGYALLPVTGLPNTGNILGFAPLHEDVLYSPNRARHLLLAWELGTVNDICADAHSIASVEAGLKQYINNRRTTYGSAARIIIGSTIDRTGCSANLETLDTWSRANWRQLGADGYLDMASSPSLGASGANASSVYFIGDGIHQSATSNLNIISPLIQQAVNRVYGNNDFSSATVYGSAASAAAATTALSESGNTVTVTFGATPANCQAGNSIFITGVTSTGYNATVANGSGPMGWYILTRSATQVTYWDNTTGLSAATIQGTGVCPEQQDADVYSIINFGAGNYTLESCQGWTGQNIHIKNVNTVASTIVPFGTETIDGAASITATPLSSIDLTSVLISAATGGCNWKEY